MRIIEKIVIPSAIPLAVLVLGYFLRSLKKEFKNARILQAEHFAHDKRIKIYESLAEKIIKTKNSINRSVICFQGVIASISGYCEASRNGEDTSDFSFIDEASKKMEELHKELNDNVEDLVNTFRAYSIAFGPDFQLTKSIEEKLSEIRALYFDNFPSILLFKCCVKKSVSLSNHVKDVRYLFNEISPEYKKKCGELLQIIGTFSDKAQKALLGPFFNPPPRSS